MTNNVWYSMVEGDMINELSIMSFTVLVSPEELYLARENGELDCDVEYLELYEAAINCYKNSFEAAFDTAWESAIVMFANNGWLEVNFVNDYVVEKHEDANELMASLVSCGCYSPKTLDAFLDDLDAALEERQSEEDEDEEDC